MIGLRSGDHVDTSDDYFVAGRSMSCYTVGMSVMAALYSGLTMLGTPGYTYTHGPVTLAAQAAIIISVPFTVSLLPVFFNVRITSAYEYLEMRFNRTLRVVGAGLFILRITMYLGSALYVPALAIEALVDAPRWVTILATGGISAAYTVTGGMRAVIWTDIMQFFVLTGALLVVTAVALWRPREYGGGDTAGIESMLETSRATGHLQLVDFSLDPRRTHSFWALAVGGIFANMIQTISDQIAVQRALSASTIQHAQNAYWMKFILNPLAVWPTIACGMALFAFYNPLEPVCAGGRDEDGMCSTTDPVSLGLIATPDQILPYFALTELPPGLPGLVVSGVLAATMSTVSSGLSSLVTVAVTDFLLPARLLDPNDQSRLLRASRWLTGASGLLAMVAALLVSEWGDAITVMDATMKGVAGGPLLGLFLLGMMSTKATVCIIYCQTKRNQISTAVATANALLLVLSVLCVHCIIS
jgi:sodium-coupled monocarboxylate transporter 8/12